jgi:hypothetical protein
MKLNMKLPKYTMDNLAPMFIKAAALRNEMLDAGFTDNGGAIHSAERIMDILGQRLNYEKLSHINNLKKYPKAEFSKKARFAHQKGKQVLIEHVAPLRDLTRKAIKEIENLKGQKAEKCLVAFVKKHYRLILLTPEETLHLNRLNRSNMDRRRLELAGIFISK